MVERRKRLRFKLRLRCEVVHLASGLKTKGETRNISSSGVLFRCEEHIPAGTTVELLILFPRLRRARRDVQLRCDARILREQSHLVFAASFYHYRFLRLVRSNDREQIQNDKEQLLIDVLDPVLRAEKTVGHGTHIKPGSADQALPVADRLDELL